MLLPALFASGHAFAPERVVASGADGGGDAVPLTAPHGSVAGFGGEAAGDKADTWTFTAPADGWYRFDALGDDSEYAVTLADPGSGHVVSSSRWREEGGALLHLKAGSRHRVSVGVLDGPGGDFTLEWSREAAPARLRRAGRLLDGGLDARGAPVEIRRAGELAFGGGRLYMASGLGLTVFERDAATGALAVVGHMDADLAAASLAWDGARGRVIAHDCGVWRSFPADGGGPADMTVAGDPGGCGRLLLDAEGGLVHRVGDAGVDAFAVGGDGALRFAGTVPVWGLRGAVVGERGRVYAAGADGLVAIERDRRTGRFVATPTGVEPAGVPLAYDMAGGRLLAAGSGGLRWFAPGSAAPARPPAADAAWNGVDGCAVAAMRAGPTVDVFCPGVVLSSRRGGAAYVGAAFDGGAPVGAAASPDGQHAYVGTRSGGLLTFARVAASSDDHGDGLTTATAVAIPSTTAGEIGGGGDRDYFRVEVGVPGTLTFETTGATNTYGYLVSGEGRPLRLSDDDGEGRNFRIATGGELPELPAGVHYVLVRGFAAGAYEFVVSGTARGPGALPAAAAPSVSVDAVPAGDEGTTATLGATLAGGTYDGALEYAWTVTGGALDNPSSATPTWTRPSVGADTSHTVQLTVTARGDGTNARAGTSDTEGASVVALVRDATPQLPAADAPGVSIDAVPDGDEGAEQTLGATLTGGTWDGALEYLWTVSGGALSAPTSATPTWTRPSVASNASHTVQLAVTARGTGTVARAGTSDTASAGVAALVRDTTAALPVASAPTVTIDAVADGDEGTKVRLGASLVGGTYDGAPEYDWDVGGGALDDDTSATPEWTRPTVASNASHTVGLTVTVHGTGTSAQTGTSATASASRAALVLDVAPPASSCVDDAKWKTVADYYDHNATRSPNYGANWYRVLIAYRLEDPERALPDWQGSTSQPTVRYTAAEATDGEAVWHGWTPVREVLECLERAFPTLPAAAAPAVSIDAVAAGDEGTAVGLSATLAGGTYDGAVEYAWSVTGGALDNATSATPAWTRPAVASDTDHTVSLAVTVHGAGANAQGGSSATANASLDTQVRDVPARLPAAAAPSVSVNAVPAGDEGTKVTLGATLTGGTYDGAVEYAWRVTGGALDNATLATPAWTRPAVGADTDHTVSLVVTVRGAGTAARTGTSDTANAGVDTRVRDVPGQLPAAAAPAVLIDAIAEGDGNTAVQLGATLTGGGYDGAAEYDWDVTGGALDDDTSAAPSWTRPPVASNTNHTVSLTVTVHGKGTSARNATSDTANASRTALVRGSGDHGDDRASATPVGIPSTTAGNLTHGDRDYFRIDIATAGTLTAVTTGSTDTYGTLFDGDGRRLRLNDDGGERYNFRIAAGTLGAGTYYLEVRGYNATKTGDYTLSVTGTARGPAALPAAAAPAVTINAVAAGDEGTPVTLGATLNGGTYDGTPEFAWSVSGGDLSDHTSATPAWTRPQVAADTDHTVSLTVTVHGADTNAKNGTSATANASLDAQVRNVAAQLPVASAPTVAIDAVADGDEGTAVGLSATLSGGTYDGALEYAWQVDGGTLRDPASATPTWTRPSVTSNTSYTVRLAVTARGAGAGARDGTSDTRNASRAALVRNIAVQLPVASAPTVAIDAIAAGDENTPVTLGATLTGGTYDGAPEYAWSVNGGRLDDPASATPTWTRPTVSADANHAVSLTVTVHGAGTSARNGTSATANASLDAQVRDANGDHGDDFASAAPIGIPSTTSANLTHGDRDYFRLDIATAGTLTAVTTGSTDTYGTLFDGDGNQLRSDDDGWQGRNFRIVAGTLEVGAYYLEVRGFRASTTGDYTLSVEGSARVAAPPPPAAAPAVTIIAIAAGDEGTAVPLGATLTGGAYDGSPKYAWGVSGGGLSDNTSATPTWTRPAVTADTNHTVSLTVTVHGTGANARNGSSATASASLDAKVRNATQQLPAAAAPSVAIDAVAAGDEGTAAGLSATVTGGLYDGALEYAWSVDGGRLSDPASATPTWTRPSVATDTNHTVRLRVTARGTGASARNGTSATANASLDAQVRNVAAQLPAAAAPTVAIDVIAAGDENTPVTLGATLTGGAYDGSAEYAWGVTGGALNDNTSPTPTWTRPVVNADGDHTVSLEVTVHGAGTGARNGTSDTANASRTAQVRDTDGDHGDDRASAAPIGIPSTTSGSLTHGDRDYFRIDIATAGTLTAVTTGSTDTYGTLFDGDGRRLRLNDDDGQGHNFRIRAGTLGAGTYYLEVRGFTASKTGDYTLSVTGSARGPATLPAASAPTVAINAVAAGDEGTPVTLGATLNGGTYDGTPEFAWSVTGGRLDDATLAAPTWTRPAVAADGDYTVGLTVTVHGTGGNALNGSSATASASLHAQVRNVAVQLPVASAPSVTIDAIADGDEGTAVGLGATEAGGTYDGALEYAWSVDGGRLSDPASATPTWTRPSVASNTSFTVRLRVTARGTGATARNGTSASANASRSASVRNVTAQLPAADAPTVRINAVAAGDEGTAAGLSATVSGGTYDGALEYAWQVDGGVLDDPASATPRWTRPAVTGDTSYTVRLTVTARGTGTVARNGTSDTASHSVSLSVRDTPPITVTTLLSGLSIPWDIAFTPDGTMLFTERAGKLSSRLTNGTVQAVTADFGDVFNQFESGLMALVVDPDFATNRRFYTCQAHTGPEVQVIAWTIDSGYTAATRIADPLVGGIPASTGGRHSGCRLRFGPDGFLWIATGDAATGTVPQDLNSLGGKVLRVNASTGAGATGNPLSSTPLIYTYGHRNPQGLALRPGTREMWMVEHGPTRDDEINLLAAGGNYGWDPVHPSDPNDPYFEGVPMTDLDRFSNAKAAKWSSGSSTLAVSGGIFLAGDRWGAWEGRLAVASLKDQSVRLFEFGSGGDLLSEVNLTQLHRAHGRLRTPMLGPDGALYVTTSNGSGDKILRIAPPATNPADAPTISIDNVAAGDESTTVQLGATLAGGTYDGVPEYDWSVNGGRLDDPTLATPTWTRPTVTSNASYTVRLTVTARGTGVNAASGTSDTEDASRTALVRDSTTQQLPVADPPTVTIDEVPIGTENTAVRLAATLDGGTYDALEYDWSVNGGTLNDASAATPKWTRPTVSVNAAAHTVRLTLTARGTGTNARNGTSAAANASRIAVVHDTGTDHGDEIARATQVPIPAIVHGSLDPVADRDYFRIDVRVAGTLVLQTTGATDTYGRLLDSGGRVLYVDDNSGLGSNFRIATASLAVGVYYLDLMGIGGAPTGSYTLSVAGTANDDEGAGAPLVSIDTVPPGLGGATVGLSATVTGGTYDGTPEYAWTVSGGRLDDPASATPNWTRPTVSANATHTVELTVTVRGTGVNAPSGTSDSLSASRSTLVRTAGGDHGNLREHATVVSVPGTESGTLTSGDQDYFFFRLASATSLSIWTTGSTDTSAHLMDRNGVAIADDDDAGTGRNFRMLRELAAGDYFVRVRGHQSRATGPYTLALGDYPNSRPRIIASEVPGAQQATAGGAPFLWAQPTRAFTDSDDEYLWVEPSSSNETVATVALEGAALLVYPHAAGTATITATARDPSGASIGASFSLAVSAPTTTPAPTASFNAAGDALTLSFTERFAAGETRAYQSGVAQISPRGGIRSFCGTVTNPATTAATENVELDLSPDDFFEPGVDYGAGYRYIGTSCSDTRYGQWSNVAEATTPGTASFDIDLVFVGSPTARVRTQVEAAVRTWERVITMSLPNIDFSNDPLPAGECIAGSPAVNDVVDDVRLFLSVASIDGPRGTLGSAGACYYRPRSGLPILGTILLDSADIPRMSDAGVRALVLHEIAHTLGFSRRFFYLHSLIRQPSLLIDNEETVGSPDTHFAGPLARAAFDAAGGSAYPGGKVPVERHGGSGSRDGHWREDVLDAELMTPWVDAGANPMSAITIQAMADLGYEVDVTQAQSYRLPGTRLGARQLGGSAAGGLRPVAQRPGVQRGEVVPEVLGACVVGGNPRAYDEGRENELRPSAARLRTDGVR